MKHPSVVYTSPQSVLFSCRHRRGTNRVIEKHQQSEKKDFFPLLKAIRLPSVFRIDVNQVLHRSPPPLTAEEYRLFKCTYKQSWTSCLFYIIIIINCFLFKYWMNINWFIRVIIYALNSSLRRVWRCCSAPVNRQEHNPKYISSLGQQTTTREERDIFETLRDVCVAI